jgi:hypothetical protein
MHCLNTICRYVEKNVCCHESYRQYNSMMPEYLWNRPRNFIKHCMSNITEVEEIPASSVVCVNQDMGVFAVQGSKSTCQYTVNFAPTIGVTPSCECLPWMKSRLLCKHFFAVFRHFLNWGFDKLSRAYTKQPHITLDEEVISISTGNNRTTNDGSPSPWLTSVLMDLHLTT